jgi:iron complex transport system substrate-binding protein
VALGTALVAVGFEHPTLARQDSTTDSFATATASWSFTDDAGRTVTLPARPERVVADLNAAAPLWDFGVRPVAVSGWTTSSDAAWGNVARTTPVISTSSGANDPDAERLLALGADLFVTITWGDEENPYSWSFADLETYQRISQIVPVVAISATGSADANIQRFAELAGLLGADLGTPSLVAAREAYDEAVAVFAAEAERQAALTTLFVYADGESEYVANPGDWADLAMYERLGLNIIHPEASPGEFWQQLSAEQAMLYPSDMLFQSTRAEVLSLEALATHPTYGQLPAVQTRQLGHWNQDVIQSYRGLTAALDTMTAVLSEATDVTP